MTSFKFLATCCVVLVVIFSLVAGEKYKICIVDGKGKFKKSLRYCPDLDTAVDSKVECIVASDRTECLRQIQKGKADFSVFSPEDLVTANNEGIEILVTNEIRYTNVPNEYEVVAIVDQKSGIKSRHDLKDKKYCHPGYGYETDWTRILSNYFEASVVTPSCDSTLTLVENKIKASREYFGAACKAGPWVNDQLLDIELKRKYPQLCSLCGDPNKCSMEDKYWGRRGSLLCLTDGAGDISWARLDDVRPHFGLVPGSAESSPDGYSFLCPDDTMIPLNTSEPCVWVVKPWPVVASRRTVADDIQTIVSPLTHSDQTSWKYSLLMLLETSYSNIYKLPSLEPIETYLDKATGFLSANSFSGCHPPRTIRICTTSIIESAKCSWVRESAAVYGVEPDLECIKADNTTHCMVALNVNAADVVMVPADLVPAAQKKFGLKTLFFETVADEKNYETVAVTRPETNILSFNDFAGKKACFPNFDGVAWNTIKHVLFKKNLIQKCPLDGGMVDFFGPSCTPGMPENGVDEMERNCQEDKTSGEFGALHCLSSGIGDVAFVAKKSIAKFISDFRDQNRGNRLTAKDFKIFCESESDHCNLGNAPIGQAMIRSNTTELWIRDTLDVFLQLENLFGKNYKSLTNAFTLFGKYEDTPDLLFHDDTQRLRIASTKDENSMTEIYSDNCVQSSADFVTYNLFTWISFCIGTIYIGRAVDLFYF